MTLDDLSGSEFKPEKYVNCAMRTTAGGEMLKEAMLFSGHSLKMIKTNRPSNLEDVLENWSRSPTNVGGKYGMPGWEVIPHSSFIFPIISRNVVLDIAHDVQRNFGLNFAPIPLKTRRHLRQSMHDLIGSD